MDGPLHLKQILPPIIWIFTEGEGDPGYLLKYFLLYLFETQYLAEDLCFSERNV